MAEKSPRPEEEEDTEEEEGEEAAEAQVRAVREEEEEKEEEEEAAVPGSPSPPEEAASSSQAPDSPPPLPPEPSYPSAAPQVPAYPHVMPVYPSVSPAFYTPEAVTYSPAVSPSVSGVNLFANDGSFLELFKKKMEATGSKEETKVVEEKKPEPDKRKPVSFVGKRRGGAKLALKTGIVAKKPKTDEEEIMTHKGGAWAQYMAEVKKYKAHQCSDDDKTRPLVK